MLVIVTVNKWKRIRDEREKDMLHHVYKQCTI